MSGHWRISVRDGRGESLTATGEDWPHEDVRFSADGVAVRLAARARLRQPRFVRKAGNNARHREAVQLAVDAPGLDGAEVVFIIEAEENGSLLPMGRVNATVQDGVATAWVRLYHPVLRPGGPPRKAEELRAAETAELRLRAELNEPR